MSIDAIANPPQEALALCVADMDTLTPEEIFQTALNAGVEVFLDQFHHAHASIPVTLPTPHREVHRVESKSFRGKLLDLLGGKTPRTSALKSATKMLEMLAFRAKNRDLNIRTMAQEDSVFIDLGEEAWRMVVVGPRGWEIRGHDEPRFVRVGHQCAFVDPVGGAPLAELFEFIPLEDEREQLLLMAWMVCALHPALQTPILLLLGQQGSGKTTCSRRMRMLLDPSRIPILDNLANLSQTLFHHVCGCWDNLGALSRDDADSLCRAVTGTGFEKRRLFTDMDQVVFGFRRAIIINAIVPVHSSKLMWVGSRDDFTLGGWMH